MGRDLFLFLTFDRPIGSLKPEATGLVTGAGEMTANILNSTCRICLAPFVSSDASRPARREQIPKPWSLFSSRDRMVGCEDLGGTFIHLGVRCLQ